MAFTLDSTLGEILKDPQAKAVLDQHLPGASSNPMVAMAAGMSLKSIVAMPQAAQMGFTKEVAEQIVAEVNKHIK